MKRTYEVADRADKRAITEFLKREGQFLLPMVELVERTEMAIDEVIDEVGRATLGAVLEMSAEGVAGPKQAGKRREEGSVVWYGRQAGQVHLSDRKVRVERPRLRRKEGGQGAEVEVPAYEAMQRPGRLADRMLEILLAGVSTRNYARVIPEMADTVGVSKSAVSRETIQASTKALTELMERRFDDVNLLIVYLDGMQMGRHHVLAGVRRGRGGQEACAGGLARGQRERRAGQGAAARPGRAGREARPAAAVRRGWLQGPEEGHRRDLRGRQPRSAVPKPQAPQRDWATCRRRTRIR